MSERKVITYNVGVKGLFGRNRTEKFKEFPILEIPQGYPLPGETTLREAVGKVLNAEKVKVGATYRVSHREETHTVDEQGRVIARAFFLMQDTEDFKGTKTSLT